MSETKKTTRAMATVSPLAPESMLRRTALGASVTGLVTKLSSAEMRQRKEQIAERRTMRRSHLAAAMVGPRP
eukprot:6114451-Pleurochrysis_carterae.AAC.4